MNKLVDTFQRTHNYLRISLTDNCNLRCSYCMPEEDYHFTPASSLMQPDEIMALAKIFVALGVNKIRLTGGEPLVRKDAAIIIEQLSTLPIQLTLTTNGTRVHDFLSVLTKAGCRHINISLDTLNPDKFLLLTRRNNFDTVYNNVHLLLNHGFSVKLNMVVMKGVNDDEINQFVALTQRLPIHVRFIEFMPFDGNKWRSNSVFSLADILQTIGQQYTYTALPHEPHETAKVYKVDGHLGSFAIISTMTAPFCGDCNRIRLTADGKLKNCLFSTTETDLLTPLRNNQPIEPLIFYSIQQKAKALGGQFDTNLAQIEPQQIHNRSMITIGG